MDNYDIEVIIYNHRPSKKTIYSGSRPAFRVKQGYLTSGTIFLQNNDKIQYGESAIGYIKFITPEAYPHCLSVGDRIDFHAGKLKVGEIEVRKVFNKLLEREQ